MEILKRIIKNDNKKKFTKIIFGLAKKINENIPDKIWPNEFKNNFLIQVLPNLYGRLGYINK